MKATERQAPSQSAKATRSVRRQQPAMKQPRQQATSKEQPSSVAAEDMHVIAAAMLTYAARTIEAICNATSLPPERVKAAFLEHGVTDSQIKQLETRPTLPLLQKDAAQLTDREKSIVDLFKKGHSNKLIARELGIAEATVKVHSNRIFKKLSVNSRSELLQLYEESDIENQSNLTVREMEILATLRDGTSKKLELPNSNVKLHIKSILKNKKSGRPKATLLIEPPPIVDIYDLHEDNIENVLPSLYYDDLQTIKKIANELAGWDKEVLNLLAEKAANGALKQWLTDETSRTNEQSDIRRQATDLGVSVSAESLNVSMRREPPTRQYYTDRADRKETAPAFVERVYGGAGWLTGEFTRADLRKLDPAAEMGLRNWERTNGRAPLNLPTLKEMNDRLLTDPRLSVSPAVTKLNNVQRARQRRQQMKTP